MSPSCPSTTSVCDPTDMNCVSPGQTVAYVNGKWCSQSQTYYSADGKTWPACHGEGDSGPAIPFAAPMIEVAFEETVSGLHPAVATIQWNVIKSEPIQIRTTTYIVQKSFFDGRVSMDPPTCPSGYGPCSPTDTSCKEKGEKWTTANTSYYCMGGQKCTNVSGGGSCVGWNEQCRWERNPATLKMNIALNPANIKPWSHPQARPEEAVIGAAEAEVEWFFILPLKPTAKKRQAPQAEQWEWCGPEKK